MASLNGAAATLSVRSAAPELAQAAQPECGGVGREALVVGQGEGRFG